MAAPVAERSRRNKPVSNGQTDQHLAELKRLFKQTGSMAFRRLQLADKVLTDDEWLADNHQGDEDRAIRWLQKHYFSDCLLGLRLEDLLRLYRYFPDAAKWKAAKYDVGVLVAEYDTAHRKNKNEMTKRERHVITHKQFNEEVAKRKEAEAQLAVAQGRIRELESKLELLHSQLGERDRTIAKLEGRLQELEKLRS